MAVFLCAACAPPMPIGRVKAAAPTPDGGLILAGTTSIYDDKKACCDLWLSRLDEQGRTLWSRVLGDNNAEDVSDVLVLDDGRIAVLGSRGENVAVTLVEADGSFVEQRVFFDILANKGAATMTRWSSNGFAVVAQHDVDPPSLLVTTFDGDLKPQWAITVSKELVGFESVAIAESAGDLVVLASQFDATTQNAPRELVVVRLNQAGEVLGMLEIDGGSSGTGIHVLPTGTIIVAGFSGGGLNYHRPGWMAAIDQSGRIAWQTVVGLGGMTDLKDADGVVTVAGSSSSFEDHGNLVVARLVSDTGEVLSAHSIAHRTEQRAIGVDLVGQRVLAAGWAFAQVQLGDDSVSSTCSELQIDSEPPPDEQVDITVTPATLTVESLPLPLRSDLTSIRENRELVPPYFLCTGHCPPSPGVCEHANP